MHSLWCLKHSDLLSEDHALSVITHLNNVTHHMWLPSRDWERANPGTKMLTIISLAEWAAGAKCTSRPCSTPPMKEQKGQHKWYAWKWFGTNKILLIVLGTRYPDPATEKVWEYEPNTDLKPRLHSSTKSGKESQNLSKNREQFKFTWLTFGFLVFAVPSVDLKAEKNLCCEY